MKLPKLNFNTAKKVIVGIVALGIGAYFVNKGLRKLGIRLPKVPIASDIAEKVEEVGKEVINLT